MNKRRIGIVGFGKLGRYLIKEIKQIPNLELVFVWNRTSQVFKDEGIDELILENLEEFHTRNPHLIVEIAHPIITQQYGVKFLQFCDYLIGSPSALANEELEKELLNVATKHTLYIPSGALWGAQDIRKMADRMQLQSLEIRMKFHPNALKLSDHLKQLNEEAKLESKQVILYNGPVRELCRLAPNNVNTMAAAAIAGHTLGFDGVYGQLTTDPGLTDQHIVSVHVTGLGTSKNRFQVETTRTNPSSQHGVTASATLSSFLSSIIEANGKGPGICLC